MTKEVADKIVRGITDKIECNTVDIDDWAEFWGFTREEYEEFLDMAIKALEQQTCEDCVSRTDALNAFKPKGISEELWMESNTYKVLTKLPSVQPQRKRGKWIAPNTSPSLMMMGIRVCSECNYETQEAGKFCTNCGAEMEGDTDETN